MTRQDSSQSGEDEGLRGDSDRARKCSKFPFLEIKSQLKLNIMFTKWEGGRQIISECSHLLL